MRGDELRFCQLPAHEGSEPVPATYDAEGMLLCDGHVHRALLAGMSARPLPISGKAWDEIGAKMAVALHEVGGLAPTPPVVPTEDEQP